MSIREKIIDYSRGNDLSRFWRLYRRQQRAKSGFRRDVLTFLMSRCAARHGGYIGPDAVIRGVPSLPHGLHGIFISRYAVIGANCRIYQNVTIGEIAGKAPEIGDGCLIGAGAVLVGGGAELTGLDKRIGDALGIPCRVADAPAACAIRGLHRIMESPEAYPAAFLDRRISAQWG